MWFWNFQHGDYPTEVRSDSAEIHHLEHRTVSKQRFPEWQNTPTWDLNVSVLQISIPRLFRCLSCTTSSILSGQKALAVPVDRYGDAECRLHGWSALQTRLRSTMLNNQTRSPRHLANQLPIRFNPLFNPDCRLSESVCSSKLLFFSQSRDAKWDSIFSLRNTTPWSLSKPQYLKLCAAQCSTELPKRQRNSLHVPLWRVACILLIKDGSYTVRYTTVWCQIKMIHEILLEKEHLELVRSDMTLNIFDIIDHCVRITYNEDSNVIK